jgi:hypothetical protein
MWSKADVSSPVPVFVSADLERLVEVPGRVPVLDQAFIDAPLISLYQASNVLWSSSTSYAPLTDWTVKKQIGVDFDPVNGSAVFTQEGLGRYLVVVVVNWDGNSSGLRKARLVSTIDGTDEVLRFITGSPPDAQAYVQQMVVGDFDAVVAGQELRVDAFQSSGAALNMQGNAPGTQTVFSLTRLQA